MQDFRQLKVYQEAEDLVVMVYELTTLFPKAERYGLTSQICRAAVSITSNIAEGSARKTSKNFAHFLVMTKGSLNELDSQLTIAQRVKLINEEVLLNKIIIKISNLSRMLFSFIKCVESEQNAAKRPNP